MSDEQQKAREWLSQYWPVTRGGTAWLDTCMPHDTIEELLAAYGSLRYREGRREGLEAAAKQCDPLAESKTLDIRVTAAVLADRIRSLAELDREEAQHG